MKPLKKPAKKICFIYKSAHYALLNNTGTLVGGAEMQQKFLADALAAKGWEVSFITEKGASREITNLTSNLTVYSVLDFAGRNKYLQKLICLPVSLWKQLKYINADIYYQRNTHYPIGLVALFCKVYRKTFIMAGASNWNFDKGNEQNLNDPLDKVSARFAIKSADKIIVQNKIQKELLLKHYGRCGNIFYNIFPPKAQRKDNRDVLWVGRIEKYKRPLLFLELAKSLPMYNFVMIGGKGADLSLNLEIEKQAAEIQNLKYLGHQPFEVVENLFDQTMIFVCTYLSSVEGFPNTFLQAWSRGIPVVSTMDLDGLISENNLGILAESITQMEAAIKKLMGDNNFMSYAENIRNFFDSNFSAPNRIQDFERILIEEMGKNAQE